MRIGEKQELLRNVLYVCLFFEKNPHGSCKTFHLPSIFNPILVGEWTDGWMDLWWLLIFPVLHLIGICLPLWCNPNSRQGHHHRQRVRGECRLARMEHRSDSYRTINVLQELALRLRQTNQKGWKLDGTKFKKGGRGGKKRPIKLRTPPKTPNLRPEFWTELFYGSGNIYGNFLQQSERITKN